MDWHKLLTTVATGFANKLIVPAQAQASQDVTLIKDLASPAPDSDLPPWEGTWPDARH